MMKRMIFLMALGLTMAASTMAMDRKEARAEARYLTDKMAYELGLSPREYDRLYDINYTYLRHTRSYDDLYAHPWQSRNAALRAFFSGRQWQMFIGTDYFYRPLSWRNGAFVHKVYVRYPRGGMPRYHSPRYLPRHERPYYGRRHDYGRHYGHDMERRHHRHHHW